MSIRTAEAVMSVGLVFQQPLTPAVKETKTKKKDTMNIEIMARIMSKRKKTDIREVAMKTNGKVASYVESISFFMATALDIFPSLVYLSFQSYICLYI